MTPARGAAPGAAVRPGARAHVTHVVARGTGEEAPLAATARQLAVLGLAAAVAADRRLLAARAALACSVDNDGLPIQVSSIEKYPGHLQALKCNSCGFQTMKVIREEIISHPTAEVKGQLVKHYQCSYCKARRKSTFKIAQIRESDQFQLPHELHFREDKENKNIDYIKIEIRTSEGASKSYEFQNLEEARQFLAETQDEKLLGLK